MSISRVSFDGNTLMDLTSDTVSAGVMRAGYTAHNAAGDAITGTIPNQSGYSITPNSSTQTAVYSGYYTTGNVTVNPVPTQSKSTSSNGVTITPDSGYYLSSVSVNIPTQSGYTITPNSSSQIAIYGGYYASGNITVSAVPTQSKSTSSNGVTIYPDSGYYLSSVTVSIPVYDGSIS